MSLNRKDMAGLRPFTNQTAPRQGRMKGSRNKLGADFLYALQREFEQHGESAIRRVRIDDPTGFLNRQRATQGAGNHRQPLEGRSR